MSPGHRSLSCLLWIGILTLLADPASARAPKDRPNIIVIFTDDQGYEDLGCFGSTTIKTPHLDEMAAEGLKLTSFYAQPVCGVSRASLLTGCYPIRVAEPRNVKQLHTNLHPEEITVAEVLGEAGYATALIGKWHAGDTMPNAQGFDYFFGTPKYNGFTVFVEDTKFRSQLLRNEEVVVEAIENWDSITRDYTEDAIAWIEKHRDRPFFLYLAHNLPHIPVGASKNFKGKSAYGPYGDAIEEIDWSSGEIFAKLKELDIDENTLVIFTSDNGPWVETTRAMQPDGKPFIPRDHSGSAAPLRGWKMSAWDGGSRVPFLARWPGQIEPGRESDEILTTMDFLPTFASLAGAELPRGRTLDGFDASGFLLGEIEASPRDDYLYYTGCLLTGVRIGDWKLVLPRRANPPGTGWWGRMIEAVETVQLYHLPSDPGESKDVAEQNPEVVARLMKRIESARSELGDIDRVGSGVRFFDEGPRRLQVPLRPSQPAGNTAAVAPRYDEFAPVGELRFTFESGDLGDWTITEGEAGSIISSHASLPRWVGKPFNREGKFHLSTIATADGFSDKQQVVVESPPFRITGPRAALLASGGFDENSLYIGLFDSESGRRLLAAGGTKGPQMQRVEWDLGEWIGRTVILRIVDRNQGGWGHLTFDDFSVEGELVE